MEEVIVHHWPVMCGKSRFRRWNTWEHVLIAEGKDEGIHIFGVFAGCSMAGWKKPPDISKVSGPVLFCRGCDLYKKGG